MNEDTLISIEMINGEKYIHYLGFGYDAGCEFVDGKPARWINYTGLMCPLKEALEYGVWKWEEGHQEFVTQYIEDLTHNELEQIYIDNDYDIIEESEITEDIPCGMYYYIAD